MKRRQSERRRGAGDMSGMRRPLAEHFVKCKRPGPITEDAEFASLLANVLIALLCLDGFSPDANRATSLENASQMSAITLPDTHFPTGDLWVFGYGSLMWRPGFEFEERVRRG